jgi:hypothetical protein
MIIEKNAYAAKACRLVAESSAALSKSLANQYRSRMASHQAAGSPNDVDEVGKEARIPPSKPDVGHPGDTKRSEDDI